MEHALHESGIDIHYISKLAHEAWKPRQGHVNFEPGHTFVGEPRGLGRKVVHVAVVNPHSNKPPSEEAILAATKGVLSAAKSHDFKELSIPLLGTGSFRRDYTRKDAEKEETGATYGSSVRAMLGAVAEHFSGDTPVRHIRIVIPASQFEEVKRAWLENRHLFESSVD